MEIFWLFQSVTWSPKSLSNVGLFQVSSSVPMGSLSELSRIWPFWGKNSQDAAERALLKSQHVTLVMSRSFYNSITQSHQASGKACSLQTLILFLPRVPLSPPQGFVSFTLWSTRVKVTSGIVIPRISLFPFVTVLARKDVLWSVSRRDWESLGSFPISATNALCDLGQVTLGQVCKGPKEKPWLFVTLGWNFSGVK